MITRIVEWVKTHKLLTVLLLIVAYFAFRVSVPQLARNNYKMTVAPSASFGSASMEASDSLGVAANKVGITMPSLPPQDMYAPTPGISNRLVIQNSYLSLLVKDVVDTRKKVLEYTTSVGGYMVNAETSNPQDAPTATITVRVPAASLEAALDTFRQWGVKVVSENIVGNDVTDQYVDIDARIDTLEKTKATMEALLERTTQVTDLTNITREVINIQSQIDSLKGTQKSLAENAKLAKITMYLSTDEIALPYAPSETFRPQVIFKLAVRSLVTHLRQLGTLAIWIVVYSVIWIPALIILYLLNKRLSRKSA